MPDLSVAVGEPAEARRLSVEPEPELRLAVETARLAERPEIERGAGQERPPAVEPAD